MFPKGNRGGTKLVVGRVVGGTFFFNPFFFFSNPIPETPLGNNMDTGPSEVISVNIGLISLGPVSMLIKKETKRRFTVVIEICIH